MNKENQLPIEHTSILAGRTEKEASLIDRLIDLAFAEDIGDGDHTTLCCIPADAKRASSPVLMWPRRSFIGLTLRCK